MAVRSLIATCLKVQWLPIEGDGQRETVIAAAVSYPTEYAFETFGELYERVKEKHHIRGPLSWNRVATAKIACYEEVLGLLKSFGGGLSAAYLLFDQVEDKCAVSAERCLKLYHVLWQAASRLTTPSSAAELVVDGGFEDQPCTGRDCHYCFFRDSACPAHHGKPVKQGQAHLHLADFERFLELGQPLDSHLAVTQREELYNDATLELLDICMGAAGYRLRGQTGHATREMLCERIDPQDAGEVYRDHVSATGEGLAEDQSWDASLGPMGLII